MRKNKVHDDIPDYAAIWQTVVEEWRPRVNWLWWLRWVLINALGCALFLSAVRWTSQQQESVLQLFLVLGEIVLAGAWLSAAQTLELPRFLEFNRIKWIVYSAVASVVGASIAIVTGELLVVFIGGFYGAGAAIAQFYLLHHDINDFFTWIAMTAVAYFQLSVIGVWLWVGNPPIVALIAGSSLLYSLLMGFAIIRVIYDPSTRWMKQVIDRKLYARAGLLHRLEAKPNDNKMDEPTKLKSKRS